jgi:valyl-tRNA synthetase
MLISGQIENHENFANRIWNRARFFSRSQNNMPHPRELELEKVDTKRFFQKSLIIGHKEAFVSVKSCNSVEDV